MTNTISPADTAFVFISSKPWYSSLGGTAKSLARELGKTFATYYINYPLDRISVWKNKHDPLIVQHRSQIVKKKQLVHVENKLYQYYPSCILESANWIPVTALFNIVNRLNNKRLAREIQLLMQRQGLQKIILVNDKDIFRGFYLKEMLQPELYVYLDRDYVLGVPYWARHGHTLEPLLMAKSDLVLCNSIPFAERALQYNRQTAFVGNGCDIHLFNGDTNLPVPAELVDLKGPVIGYAGALVHFRLDLPLLEKLAAENPQWNFVFIGKEDEAFKASDLHKMPNVYFAGFKSLETLPAYYSHFDVCINPQVVNDITDGNYPMKIDEYLAMGRPVVAIKTKAMAYFADHCYLATDAETFAGQIRTALKENTETLEQQRISFARGHSWEAFTKQVLDLIRRRLEEHLIHPDVN